MRCRVRCEAFPRSARSRFADTCLHLVARRSNFLAEVEVLRRNAADSPVDKFEDALESSVNRTPSHDHTVRCFREVRGCVPYPDGADESGPVFECVGDAVAFVVCMMVPFLIVFYVDSCCGLWITGQSGVGNDSPAENFNLRRGLPLRHLFHSFMVNAAYAYTVVAGERPAL